MEFVSIVVALLPTVYLQTYFFTNIVQQFAFPLDSSNEKAFDQIENRDTMWNVRSFYFLF